MDATPDMAATYEMCFHLGPIPGSLSAEPVLIKTDGRENVKHSGIYRLHAVGDDANDNLLPGSLTPPCLGPVPLTDI
jgi:hypothetical protein